MREWCRRLGETRQKVVVHMVLANPTTNEAPLVAIEGIITLTDETGFVLQRVQGGSTGVPWTSVFTITPQ